MALVGGAVLGAAFGEVFAVLHETVKNVGSKVLMFKSELKSLKSKLDLLEPVVKEVEQLNIQLSLPEKELETKSVIEDLNKAKELIRTCSATPEWNPFSKANLSKQLTKLDKAIEKFCQVHMPAQIKRDTSKILNNMSQILQILEDKSSQILGKLEDTSQSLGNTSQILEDTSQVLEDTSQILHILEDKLSQILGKLEDTSQILHILEDKLSQILGNMSQILHILEDKLSQILGNTSQILHILEDKLSQILGNTSQISGNTSQILQILEDMSSQISQISHNLEDKLSQISQTLQMTWEELKALREEIELKEKVQVLITPSEQGGKTITLEIHGHDVRITGSASIYLMTSLSGQNTPSSSFISHLTPRQRYDVFLNFRNGNSRRGFGDLLAVTLERNGIVTFIDRSLSHANTSLMKGIEESMFAIVIISRDFARSRRCLDELQKIVKCRTETGMRILPIFYGVKPSNVRKQSGYFGRAFTNHKKHFGKNNERVGTWKAALTYVTKLSAWNSRDHLNSDIIESVMEQISHTKSYYTF